MRLAIILNYKHYSQTISCVKQLLKAGVNYVIVVDNGSPNESLTVLEATFSATSQVVVINTSDNVGYARGNNFGLAYAAEHYGVAQDHVVYIVNPDTRVSAENLCDIEHFILNHDDAGVVSVPQRGNAYTAWHHMRPLRSLFFNSRLIAKVMAKCGKREIIPYNLGSAVTSMPVDVVSGAFFGIRQDIFAEIGGFDPGTFLSPVYNSSATP